MKSLKKYKWFILAVVFAFFLGYAIKPSEKTTAHTHTEKDVEMWTCSMHPQIRQPEFGSCPICAMDLIPVQDEGSADLGERQLYLSPQAVKLADVQTSSVHFKRTAEKVKAYGKIVIDETRLKTTAARISGRVEKLYVDFTGALVRAGEPLLEIYSPELYVAQQEYLQAIKLQNDFPVPLADIEKKFELLGFSLHQLDDLKKRGIASDRMVVYAPIDGVVLNRHVVAGDYVKTGYPLYEIADLSKVWIHLNIYEKDIAKVRTGESLSFTVKALAEKSFSAHIDFIDPVVDDKSGTIKVRAVAENDNNMLKPGMLVHADLQATTKSELLVPASAILLTGERAVVYIALEEGVFEGREIQVGSQVGDYFIVKSGLNGNERVVTNGAFKVDSEMQILAKPSMMSPESTHDSHGHTEYESEENPDISKHAHAGVKAKPVQKELSAPPAEKEDMRTSLDAVYLTYFKIQHALSHDKVNVQTMATELIEMLQQVNGSQAVHGRWNQLAMAATNAAELITETENVSIVRSEFKKLSDAMIQIVAEFGHSDQIVVRQYHCPMAFNDAGADWLSNKLDVENPYYGSQMFRCGFEVEKIGLSSKGGKK